MMQRHQQPQTMSIDFVRDELVQFYNDKNNSESYKHTLLKFWKTTMTSGGTYREAYRQAVKQIEANHDKA